MAATALAVLSQMVPRILEGVNTKLFGAGEMEEKSRWLKISIVNTTDDQKLLMEDNWFDTGRFWTQPFEPIGPNSAVTFGVCKTDGSFMTGVSGGVGFRAYDVKTGSRISDGAGDWWICTFSNPFMGCMKWLTRWKGFGIKPLWDEMEMGYVIRDERCGCYMKDNNHIVFVWKNPRARW